MYYTIIHTRSQVADRIENRASLRDRGGYSHTYRYTALTLQCFHVLTAAGICIVFFDSDKVVTKKTITGRRVGLKTLLQHEHVIYFYFSVFKDT